LYSNTSPNQQKYLFTLSFKFAKIYYKLLTCLIDFYQRFKCHIIDKPDAASDNESDNEKSHQNETKSSSEEEPEIDSVPLKQVNEDEEMPDSTESSENQQENVNI
jgi:hypothetical protein